MAKKQIKVRVVGSDHSVNKMFRDKESPYFKYVTMDSDIWDKPDLVCFTGGEDINPILYEETPIKETKYSKVRDDEDTVWYNRYKDVPKVGICRGGQFLNVMSGGAMWQHVDNHSISHDIINLLPIGARWAMGDIFKVTSTHHQMMIPGVGGEVLAIATVPSQDRGLASKYLSSIKRDIPKYDTEVVFYEETKSLCYQPHPEYYTGTKNSPNEKYFFDLIETLLIKE